MMLPRANEDPPRTAASRLDSGCSAVGLLSSTSCKTGRSDALSGVQIEHAGASRVYGSCPGHGLELNLESDMIGGVSRLRPLLKRDTGIRQRRSQMIE